MALVILMCHAPTLVHIIEESLPAHTPFLTGVGVVVTEGCELGISEVGEAQGAHTLRGRARNIMALQHNMPSTIAS